MVLINADTLAGLDENPAELNGYGPISAETARAMILDALHWTPLIQDPSTGEILNVGRTRRIPSGLKRWLQARDGTCRFPGCSVSVTHAEIDHTKPFSHGGPTDHANLEHLCPKHHRFKTLGHWTARQPEPGTIEWHSPTGRTYATGPTLEYQHAEYQHAEYQQPESQQAELQPTTRAPEQRRHPHPPSPSPSPEDDPPPF
ncbi:HNH endonuclease signature motif containing protein [Arthrobacter koreensis]|uniref:HNH endonuclease signature motif containing protein n=1 Tax=Arthrobacter koreensis TaxID=199136 RepID=UPI003AD155DC